MRTVDISRPQGSEAPSVLDDSIRNLAAATQERLGVDHHVPLNGTQWDQTTDAGKHDQVTLLEANADPAPQTGEGVVYAKTVSDVVELFYYGAGMDTPKQLTQDGLVLLAVTDLEPIIDGTTLIATVDDQDNPVLGVNVDGVSIGYDETSETVMVLDPAAPATADSHFGHGAAACVMSYGRYIGTGQATQQQIPLGINAWLVIIKRDGAAAGYVVGKGNGAASIRWNMDGYAGDDLASLSGTDLVIATANSTVNANGSTYCWWAIGTR